MTNERSTNLSYLHILRDSNPVTKDHSVCKLCLITSLELLSKLLDKRACEVDIVRNEGRRKRKKRERHGKASYSSFSVSNHDNVLP